MSPWKVYNITKRQQVVLMTQFAVPQNFIDFLAINTKICSPKKLQCGVRWAACGISSTKKEIKKYTKNRKISRFYDTFIVAKLIYAQINFWMAWNERKRQMRRPQFRNSYSRDFFFVVMFLWHSKTSSVVTCFPPIFWFQYAEHWNLWEN